MYAMKNLQVFLHVHDCNAYTLELNIFLHQHHLVKYESTSKALQPSPFEGIIKAYTCKV